MITSTHNPKVQEVRQLLNQTKIRHERGMFVVEGVRLAEEALQSGWNTHWVLFSERLDQRGMAVVDAFAKRGVVVEAVSPAVMDALSETETPQGLLVVLVNQTLPIPPSPDFLLILDGIRDPGNLGTILRTGAAAGVQGVLLAPGCADATSPKVLRAGMGAHFHLPLVNTGWNEIHHKLDSIPTLRIYLADSAGGIPYAQADFRSPLALIVGGEAAGASKESASIANKLVHIPMPGKTESLNAAVATGILLFEVVRQRAGREN